MDYFLRDTDDVLLELQTSESGLTVSEATRRLAEYGRNELEKAKRKPLIIRLLSQLVDPMVIILLVAALVSAIIAAYSGGGLHEYADVAIILAVVVINSILGVYQENKAENAIDALQQMSATTAKVRRDNDVLVVQSAELVIGDIVLVEAGDVVPADIRLIECASLRTEEAALTGESLAVDKQTEAISSKTGKVALGDRTNMIYMGSDIVAGRAEGVVVATAMKTEMGSIASLIQTTEDGETPLQIKLAQLSKILTYAVLGICAIVFVIDLIHDGKISTDSLLDSFMIAVSLAVAAIPEGLVAVVTIVLSIGVTNMANRRAIIRRLTAVETLRCAQVICTDKTGTLTQNKMTVVEVYGSTDLLVPAMALCTDSQLSSYGEIIGEPTENALVAKAIDAGVDFTALKLAEPRVAEVPFDSTRKMMTTIHQTDQGIIQYTKGAPDVILGLCTHVLIDNTRVVEINDELMIAITQRMSRYAADALRVLAAAYREWDELPEEISTQTVERGMVFIGLAAMHDPVRPEVKGAIDQCRAAGIQVVMITGDHVDTAAAIGKQLGIIYRSD
ncbi:MAG: HAD-IC family P-type ATPase, partial [Coriobacteriia bacterium]|nr:HAD-IC family P-type ATPase [Coriobacteriia bacterium]